jgi:hypothetical protein
MSDIVFDEATHTYSIDGTIPLMGVTTIIRESGLMDLRYADEAALGRGETVHTMTELFDKGQLDLTKFENPAVPYLEGWKKFRSESNAEILEIEQMVAHKAYRYAGRVDRYIRLNGHEAILDIKTGVRAPWHGVQLAGYRLCYPNASVLKCYCLYLSNDGKYRLEPKNDPGDERIFLAALTIAQWKVSKGLAR